MPAPLAPTSATSLAGLERERERREHGAARPGWAKPHASNTTRAVRGSGAGALGVACVTDGRLVEHREQRPGAASPSAVAWNCAPTRRTGR